MLIVPEEEAVHRACTEYSDSGGYTGYCIDGDAFYDGGKP